MKKFNAPELVAEFISRSNLTWDECPKRLDQAISVFNTISEEIGEDEGLSLFFLYNNPKVSVRVKNDIKAIS